MAVCCRICFSRLAVRSRSDGNSNSRIGDADSGANHEGTNHDDDAIKPEQAFDVNALRLPVMS